MRRVAPYVSSTALSTELGDVYPKARQSSESAAEEFASPVVKAATADAPAPATETRAAETPGADSQLTDLQISGVRVGFSQAEVQNSSFLPILRGRLEVRELQMQWPDTQKWTPSSLQMRLDTLIALHFGFPRPIRTPTVRAHLSGLGPQPTAALLTLLRATFGDTGTGNGRAQTQIAAAYDKFRAFGL